jgi:GntR family transcriptional repressor for pyruvate dehydrogenase complex
MEIIHKRNLSEAVAEQLLSLISTGELKAGSKLPSEFELCRVLGVSRTAVREGIRALAGTNVLTALPGRGTFVNENPGIMVKNDALKIFLDRETVNSIYEVRSVLDVGIAQLATMRANKEDVKALRRATKKMEKSLESDPYDFDLAMEGNEEFHFAFCEAAHNKILENIAWPIINHNMMNTWKQLDDSLEIVKARIKDHKDILEGVEKRDKKRVVNAVRRHLKGAFERISAMSDAISLVEPDSH